MSDHGHHDPGGHELEAINTKLLFRLLVSLTFITFIACVVVVQWFYKQRRELDGRYAAEGSYQLQNYKAKMATDLEGIDRLTQDIAANPALLNAPPPPSGWMHPDDLVAAAAAAAAPAAEHEEVEPVPVELPSVEDPAPAEGEDAAPEPKPAEGEDAPKPAKPAKPAEGEGAPKPAKPAKPAKPTEPAKPADTGE